MAQQMLNSLEFSFPGWNQTGKRGGFDVANGLVLDHDQKIWLKPQLSFYEHCFLYIIYQCIVGLICFRILDEMPVNLASIL